MSLTHFGRPKGGLGRPRTPSRPPPVSPRSPLAFRVHLAIFGSVQWTLQKFPHGENTHNTKGILMVLRSPSDPKRPPKTPLNLPLPPPGPPEAPPKITPPPPGSMWGSRTAENPPWDTFGPPTSGQVSQNKILLPTGTAASFLFGPGHISLYFLQKIEAPPTPPQGGPECRDPFGTLPGAIWDPSGTFLDLSVTLFRPQADPQRSKITPFQKSPRHIWPGPAACAKRLNPPPPALAGERSVWNPHQDLV